MRKADYRCLKCEHVQERAIKEEPKRFTTCEQCGGKAARIFQLVNFVIT